MFFITPSQKPKHWYTREITLYVPLWPKWLAQRLCQHENSTVVGWQEHKAISQCRDCYKCSIVPNSCTHPMESLVIDTTIPIPTDRGGQTTVPYTWHCANCCQSFTREMDCPNCHVEMEITEYMGEFSGRFRCPQCCDYFFREDL